MRYGIFSDIHSNLEALDAVIEACKNEQIERYLCIGDIVSYGANPCECIQKVKELKAVIVAGNHEWGVCAKFGLENFTPLAQAGIEWTARVISRTELDFLGSLPLIQREENFVLAHSTLDMPKEFYYLDTYDEASRTFAFLDAQVCFVGHTHKPKVFIERDGELFSKALDVLRLEDDKRYIINVGSVGQPRDYDPRACLVIYDTLAETIELKRVAYDLRAAQEKIIKAGLPKALAVRLAEGR